MDPIGKLLKKLTERERAQIKQVLIRLYAGRFQGLDIKKLKSREDIFRVRKGNFRILYQLVGGDVFILAIERRREDTYDA